jgi:hypothetical protein
MGQILHGSARTTEAVRRAIQHSQESLRTLSRRYGVNPKTIAKWRARARLPTGAPGRRTRARPCSRRNRALAGGRGHRRRLPTPHALAAQIPDLIRDRAHEPNHQEPAPEGGDATVKRFHYESHDQLRQHLADFVQAYNFGRRLKTLKGLTPYEFICEQWTSEPKRFSLNPLHQMPGLNI